MSQASESQSNSSNGMLPAGLREVPAQLREVPGLPFRASRHLTAWIVWQTSRVSVLADHEQPQPPDAI